MIRTYHAETGSAFGQAASEKQRRRRDGLLALAVIAATALSAATVISFNDRAASLTRADFTTSWAP